MVLSGHGPLQTRQISCGTGLQGFDFLPIGVMFQGHAFADTFGKTSQNHYASRFCPVLCFRQLVKCWVWLTTVKGVEMEAGVMAKMWLKALTRQA